MKHRTVIYTPEAGDDLDWIYDTVARASGATTANRYDARIRAFCERLNCGSERGTLRNDVLPGLRLIGFEHSISVAFVVEDTQVLILRVFYGRANWAHHLSGKDE